MHHSTICIVEGCNSPVAIGTRGRLLKYCGDECRWEQRRRNASARVADDPYAESGGVKKCGHCQEAKPSGEYHADKKRKDGLYPWCKDCRRNYMGASRREARTQTKAEYDRARLEKIKRDLGEAQWSEERRGQYLFNTYGISLERYAEILEEQGGGCAICGLRPNESPIAGRNGTRRYFAVDHDHSCCAGKRSCGQCVRGVLCHNCNIALGAFKDDPAVMRTAINYITGVSNA